MSELLFMDRTTVLRQARSGGIPGATKLAGTRGAWIFDRDQINELARQRIAERRAAIDRLEARMQGAAS